jgi:hypothetical protein
MDGNTCNSARYRPVFHGDFSEPMEHDLLAHSSSSVSGCLVGVGEASKKFPFQLCLMHP